MDVCVCERDLISYVQNLNIVKYFDSNPNDLVGQIAWSYNF